MNLRTTFEQGLVAPLLALPDASLSRVVEKLGGPPITRGVPLDLRAALLMHLDRRLHAPLEHLPPEQARIEAERRVAVTLGSPPDGVLVESVRLDHPKFSGGLSATLYRPRFSKPGPLIMYFHQGGFVVGRPEWASPIAGILVGLLSARVVSVGYRLSPERPLPEIQEDALAAVRSARARAAEWGALRDRWVAAGDSAGGYLSAWLAQTLPVDERPNAQVLIYPLLDFRAETRSRIELQHAHPVSEGFIGWSEALSLPQRLDRLSPEISPGRRENLVGLPPALVVTAGFDPLLDEGDAYARRLAEADVPVRHRRFLHLPHGFTALGGAVPQAGDAMRQIARDLAVLLARPA